MKERTSIKAIAKYAGGFIAWVIGSGFATGQEILQFFTSYGWQSYGVVLIDIAGFIFLGMTLLTDGFEHKTEPDFLHYQYYCGKKLGALYAWIIPVTLFLTMAVLVSAAGATLNEYYGFNKYVGSAAMALLVLAVYLIGFEKMLGIISLISPVIIVFSIFVGAYTVIKDFPAFQSVSASAETLERIQTAPHWSVSAVLYLSLNFLCGSTYYAALGRSAGSRSEAKWGAVTGAAVVVVSITLMNTAILLNAADASALDVPALYLANRISGVFGKLFSVVLVLGMFSSCSTMMWSLCSRVFANDRKKNALAAACVALMTFALGLFPFSGLVSVIYPLIGWSGLAFIACVLYKRLAVIKRRSENNTNSVNSVS